MTGPDHYRAAEKHLSAGTNEEVRVAQVHAILALAAASAYSAVLDWSGNEVGSSARAWAKATGQTDLVPA